MTAAATYPPVICGARETRTTGVWECVKPAGQCDGGHYYILLNRGQERT